MSECNHVFNVNHRCIMCGISDWEAGWVEEVKRSNELRSARIRAAIPNVPAYVTVADCGHCFEDTGEPA